MEPREPIKGSPTWRSSPWSRRIVLVWALLMAALVGVVTWLGYTRSEARLARTHDEAGVISTLETLVTAQKLFRQQQVEVTGVPGYATSLAELQSAELLHVEPWVELSLSTPSDRQTWFAEAHARHRPELRHFAIDQTGALRVATGRHTTAADPLVNAEAPN